MSADARDVVFNDDDGDEVHNDNKIINPCSKNMGSPARGSWSSDLGFSCGDGWPELNGGT